MNRRYKVKHYRSRIYNPIKGKIIKTVAIILASAVLFAVGWFAYEPLMQAVNEKNKEIIEKDPVPAKPQEPAYEPLPEEFLEKETVAVTVPEEFLYSSINFYTFLKSLDEEVTAVVLDMKTRQGTVTYTSDQVSVINAGAVHEEAMDIDKRIKTAKDMGFDVVTRIFAFEDSTAPYNADDMAIRYESEDGVLWLDDSVDNGGKPWLNPYSDTAQKYVLDIVFDAIDSGADAILLDGMRFPENEGMDYAYFGAGAEDISKGDILSRFAQRIYSSAVLTDTDIIIAYDAFAVVDGSDIYGTLPTEFIADGYAPCMDFNAFVGEKFGNDYRFRQLPEDLAEMISAIYDSLGGIAGLKLMPVLECDGFEKSDFASVIDYIMGKGAAGYAFIYNEAFFTGIPEEPLPEENLPAEPQQPQIPYVPQQPQQPEPEPEEEPEEENGSTNYWSGEEEKNPGVTIRDYTEGD
ncbi:MAG: hypothetical protein E7489_05945 [Ruminococcaceae bacterium]|nr:hypothetical protein [Oscillospiraceae bacterium]MBQ4117588.1 hypothetical protein [Oscillospiraceae bacterium]